MFRFHRLAAAAAENYGKEAAPAGAAPAPAARTERAETPANTATVAADSSAGKLHGGGGAGSASGGDGGGGYGALPTGSEAEGRSEEYSKWAEALRNLQSRATMPEFTEQTVDVIARIVSGQYK